MVRWNSMVWVDEQHSLKTIIQSVEHNYHIIVRINKLAAILVLQIFSLLLYNFISICNPMNTELDRNLRILLNWLVVYGRQRTLITVYALIVDEFIICLAVCNFILALKDYLSGNLSWSINADFYVRYKKRKLWKDRWCYSDWKLRGNVDYV